MRRALAISLLLLPALATITTGAGGGAVYLTRVSGAISPATADFLEKALAEAQGSDAECFILVLDTPGGLELSMRTMVTAIMESSVPVVVYVAPGGARAASAGAFVTLAAHVAAMAPGTNIGAAHPVQMGAKESSDELAEKATNDAAAFMRSIAQQRGRNQDWAERAVRESISSSADEALAAGVVDLVVLNEEALLAALEGREIEMDGESIVLEVADKELVEITMGFRHRVLGLLSDPNVAYVFLTLGMLGLFFELSNPGSILPGVVGGIFLILAFFALQTLPVNIAGLLLILFSLLLFVAEVKVASFGLLTVGGIVSLLLGSLLLFESPAPFLRVSWLVMIPVVIGTAGFIIVALFFSVRVHRRRPTTGQEGMVGLMGVSLGSLSPTGQVRVRGEVWWAESDEEIAAGDEIEVVELLGPLKLKVAKRGRKGDGS